jgi:hypothetical protein
MNWDTELNMEWNELDLVQAALVNQRDENLVTTDDELRRKIATCLSRLSDEQRKLVGAGDITGSFWTRRLLCRFLPEIELFQSK